MTEEINTNRGNAANQSFPGVLQWIYPAGGWALVLPAGSYNMDDACLCRLPYVGGILGGGIFTCAQPGTPVWYTKATGTDMGQILQFCTQGTQGQTYTKVALSRQVQGVIPTAQQKSSELIVQRIQNLVGEKNKAAYTGGLEDQYAGDVVIGDKNGPFAFFGRAQITVTGSDLSYTQYSALNNKITTVTVESQLDTLSDKHTISTNLNKTLKASGILQGLGGRGWEDKQLLQKDEELQTKLKDQIKAPIFRFQQFNGGAVCGYHTTIVCPLQQKQDKQPVVMAQLNSYQGQHLRLSAKGNTFIKTPFVSGLVQKTYKSKEDTQDGKKQRKSFQKRVQQLVQKYSKTQLSQDGLQRVLQLDAIIKEDTRQLLYDMLGTAVTEMLGEDVEALPEPFGTDLSWQGEDPQVTGYRFGDYPTVDVEDKVTKRTIKQFKNTSFITQDPDGTITFKDGWGSQITMSHGNIYISSALDTFIRPGRKLVAMVPSDICISNNGEIQVASKKDIKVGSEKNLTLSSAIGGQLGYTVLENRTKKRGDNTGIVIRSNGYLSLTSSDDMHIGINDKREENKGDSANYGSGSIFIQGQKVRLQATGELRLVGSQAGIYGCNKTQGCGMQISTSSITLVSPAVNMDTGVVQVGKFSTAYTIRTGSTGENTVTLRKGGQSLVLHVRGQVQCKGLVSDGVLQATKPCIAASYSRLQTTPQLVIYGTKKEDISAFKSLISGLFKTPLRVAALSFAEKLQEWYKDSFICKKELSFTDSWSATGNVPAMCWQMQQATGNYDPFFKISVKSTGENKETCSYPGKSGWQQNSIITVDSQYNIQDNIKLDGGYKTYTKEGK